MDSRSSYSTNLSSKETFHLCLPTSMISGTSGDLRCNTLNWVNSGLQCFIDVLLVILFLLPIWTSKLNIKQKMMVVGPFSLGGLFNIIMAILRGYWSYIAFTDQDFSWHWARSVLWMTLEIAVAHTCATIPFIIMPLSRKCLALKMPPLRKWSGFGPQGNVSGGSILVRYGSEASLA